MGGAGRTGRIGVVVALERELGELRERLAPARSTSGVELLEGSVAGREVLAVIAGVGKVRAAAATAVLVETGVPGGVLSLGVCGGLRSRQEVGDLVHCTRAVQADLAVRQDREVEPDPDLLAAWRRAVPGRAGPAGS